jgi:hypothetical protein
VPLYETLTNAADYALTTMNNAMLLSVLKKDIFFGTCISIIDNLIPITALHSSTESLDNIHEISEKLLNKTKPGHIL